MKTLRILVLVLISLTSIAAQSITTESCEDILRPMFLDNQRRALSMVISLANGGRIGFAREEVSVRAMCNDPLLCGTIVHNSVMPIAFSDDVGCVGGRVQPFNVQEQRGLFFDPFHLNIHPSGYVTFSPSPSFCGCDLQPTEFNLTCYNGHIFGFDEFNNMYTFVFENITSYSRLGSACTSETTPTTAPCKRGVRKSPTGDDIVATPACMLSVAVSKSTKNFSTVRKYAYDLTVTNVGKCTAHDIKVRFTLPHGAVVKDYDSVNEKILGLETLKSDAEFKHEGLIVADEGSVIANAVSSCSCK